MKQCLRRILPVGMAVLGVLATVDCYADAIVTVRATAKPEYTQRKYGGGRTTPETYVLKAGRSMTDNLSGEGRDPISCRMVAEALAPELARQQYWPAKKIEDADLGFVVSWGFGGGVVQWPARPRVLPAGAAVPGNSGQLLVDRPTIPDMPTFNGSYFITLEAYDLHGSAEERQHPVWTINLSIHALGNDDSSALNYMSAAAAEFVGRSTEDRRHVRPVLPKNRIETGPVLIVGDEAGGPGAARRGVDLDSAPNPARASARTERTETY